jgi:hypothetical protein
MGGCALSAPKGESRLPVSPLITQNSHTPTPSLLYRTLCSDASGRAPDRERVRFNEAEEAQRRAASAAAVASAQPIGIAGIDSRGHRGVISGSYA